METKTKLCDGCDTRKPSGKIFCIQVQRVWDVCATCRVAFVKSNIKESGEVMYKALVAAVKQGSHDPACPVDTCPSQTCSCWYGKASDALDIVNGEVK